MMDNNLKTELELKMKKGRILLFDHESDLLIPLQLKLSSLSHRALICYIHDIIKSMLTQYDLSSYHETIIDATNKNWLWATGKIKMDAAKKTILNLHLQAKTASKQHAYLLHAIAQGLSVTHTKRHAMGLAFYELSGLYEKYRNTDIIQSRITWYLSRSNNIEIPDTPWANFIKG